MDARSEIMLARFRTSVIHVFKPASHVDQLATDGTDSQSVWQVVRKDPMACFYVAMTRKDPFKLSLIIFKSCEWCV
jgi:hypothetical protein